MIQLQVLNYLLDTKDSSFILMNNLNEDFFSDYKDEFNYINEHYSHYGNLPDKETFLAKFTNFDVVQVNETPKFLLDALYEDKNRRDLVKVFNEVRVHLNSGATEEALQLFNTAAEKLSTAVHLDSVDVFKDTSRYEAYTDKLNNLDQYFVTTGLKELDELLGGGWDRQEELATIVARTNTGKCLEKGTKVLMADGTTKEVEDVKVGDKVQSLGCTNTVLGLHNGVSNGYKIITSDKESFVCSENHILTCWKYDEIWDSSRKVMTTNLTGKIVDIVIEDYLKLSAHQKRLYRLIRPEISYETKELPIDPYVLGLWLGDGTSRDSTIIIANNDTEIISYLKNYCASNGFEFKSLESQQKENCSLYNLKGGFLQILKNENLINNKHIPLNYITSSKYQRLQLIAGLLDTDGYYSSRLNNFEFSQKNKFLFDGFVQLCRSVGLHITTPTPKCINNNLYYRANIYGNLTEIPTRVSRKKALRNGRRNPTYIGFKVEPVKNIEYYGFMCDGDHRYMLANGILTHNTWMLLKCAVEAAKTGLNVGLYSGEMSENKVGYRVDTLVSNISNSAIMHGNDRVQTEYREYINKLNNGYIKGSLKVLTPAMISGSAGVTALKAFIEKEHLDMLCIDQHSLLEDDRHAKNVIERAANISKDLKNLQVLEKIPIIAVSQQNRASTENGIDTTMIAQSDRIGQDSTVVLFFEKKDGIMTISLVKARDVANGQQLQYAIDFDKGVFEFMPHAQGDMDADTKALAEEYGEDTPW